MGRYDHLYSDPELKIVYNDHDPDLVPFTVDLPQPGDFITKNKLGKDIKHPSLEKIDGYGLKPKDQKFQRPKKQAFLLTSASSQAV